MIFININTTVLQSVAAEFGYHNPQTNAGVESRFDTVSLVAVREIEGIDYVGLHRMGRVFFVVDENGAFGEKLRAAGVSHFCENPDAPGYSDFYAADTKFVSKAEWMNDWSLLNALGGIIKKGDETAVAAKSLPAKIEEYLNHMAKTYSMTEEETQELRSALYDQRKKEGFVDPYLFITRGTSDKMVWYFSDTPIHHFCKKHVVVHTRNHGEVRVVKISELRKNGYTVNNRDLTIVLHLRGGDLTITASSIHNFVETVEQLDNLILKAK